MKTIEQKAKAYDKAISLIKDYNRDEEGFICVKPENIFPELAESEDERIRKEIISHLHHEYVVKRYVSDVEYDRWIAWLKKQGEQKPKFRVGDTIKCKYDDRQFTIKSVDLDKGTYNYTQEGCGNDIDYADEEFEIVEQKPADKNEPKFKIGDWITNGEYTWKVKDIKSLDYILQSQDGHIVDDTISYVDYNFRLWTIKDANNGDILAVDNKPFIYNGSKNEVTVGAYFGFNAKHFFSFAYNYVINQNITPATKEQRDTLMKAMADAGYTFDFDKKELKKIEQKPAWSEEDERISRCLIEDQEESLDKVSNDKYGHSEIISDLTEMYDERIDWLKSLKDRVGCEANCTTMWKPSDEQIEALEHFVRSIGESGYASPYENNTKLLYSLLEQLKKL